MHVQLITTKHLKEAAAKYPDAASELGAWVRIVKAARWTGFVDVRQSISDADAARGYVIFNIRRNRYRLITVIHYVRVRDGASTLGRVYIRSFLTHKQYDDTGNWDKEYGQ